MKIFALVVWFNPECEYVKNILTYRDFVDDVIVIDNSSFDNANLLFNWPMIKYEGDLKNKGIAKALNIGCRQAIEAGADWVLTMDQDSSFEPGQIAKLIANVTTEALGEKIAIFSPKTQGKNICSGAEDCDSVITSGSLVSLAAYQEISGYNEDLFIDDVDHEFGYRLKNAGYRILRLNNVAMNHTIGDPFSGKFLWRQIKTTNHNYIRKYYMTRSRLYMRDNYPEFGAPYLKMIFMDLLKVILVENEKYKKIKYMAKGVIDYYRGVKGELIG